jgi:hypothetical protein
LTTGILIDSRNEPNYYQRFYIRPALRILPFHYFLLAVLLLIRSSSWPFVAFSAAYPSNIAPIFGVPLAYSVLWSSRGRNNSVVGATSASFGLLCLRFVLAAALSVFVTWISLRYFGDLFLRLKEDDQSEL